MGVRSGLGMRVSGHFDLFCERGFLEAERVCADVVRSVAGGLGVEWVGDGQR